MRGSGSSYNKSLKEGWLNEICLHMVSNKKPNGYWNNYENCKEASLSCKTRNEFRKISGAYSSSIKNGWLDKFFPKNKK
jgi:hypothetical protein